MAKLNKISVAYISLVKNPANKLDIVYKSSDAKFTDEKQIKITKSEPEGIVYGTVYEPNVKDSDGERVKIDKAGESSSFQEFDFNVLD